jgi:pimeloyl-ACP methyl ester carboxylesterase
MHSPSQPIHFLAPYQGRRPAAPAWFEEALDHKPERTFFRSSEADLELLTWGRIGAPGLLFLHGNGAHADWWSHIAPFFAAEWRCAAFSYSGMGRSDWRAGGYTVAGFAAEVIDAVAAAGLDQGPVAPIIVAHSFGGAIGMAAACHDKTFSGLIMIDTPVNLDRERLREIKSHAPKARSEQPAFTSLADGLARFRLAPPQDCGNDFIGDHIARCALVERNGKWHWHFDPRRITVEDDGQDDIVSQVRCPMAYFYGARSALVTPEVMERSLEVFRPGTPVVPIPDAAHHVLIDQPLALVSSLRTLLACWPACHNSKGDIECHQS